MVDKEKAKCVACVTCNGSGVVPGHDEVWADVDDPDSTADPCPTCGGAGQ